MLADQSEGCFQVALSRAKCVSVNGEGRTNDNERRAISGRIDGLLNRKPADCLNRDGNCVDNLAQAIERSGGEEAALAAQRSHIVANVMDDVITTKRLKQLRARYGIRHVHVVAHDLGTQIAAGLGNQFYRFLVSLAHYNDHVGASFDGHLGLEPTTVSYFEICNDRCSGKAGPQFSHAAHALGNDERRTNFKPVYACADRERGCFDRFFEVYEIKRDLYNRAHGEGERAYDG